MEILQGDVPAPAALRGAVVALGNFDGFHIGHQAVVGAAARVAAQTAKPLAVLSFDPHPALFFRPDAPPFALTTQAQKLGLLERFGVDLAVVVPFTAALAGMSAEGFVEAQLAQRLGVSHVVAGYDFTYGKGRAGDGALMRSLGARLGFGVSIVSPVAGAAGEAAASSTRVRQALQAGRPAEAAALMGRWWRIAGQVQKGDQRGRTIGFPTANVPLGDYLRPALGVYAVRLHRPGALPLLGVANLGKRPTFDKVDELLEVHAFDFAGDLYGQDVEVELVEFLRPEQKFSGLEALKAQIGVDSAAALTALAQADYAADRFPAVTRRNYT
jgi:riboflavin kinase / FMN adenylyltransferase